MNNSLRSVTLSRIITTLLLAVVILCVLLLPFIMKAYFHYRQMPPALFLPLLILCYGCALAAVVALVGLLQLLTRIAKGILFDRKNSALLLTMAVCCLVIALLTAIGTAWYFPCVIIAVAAVFLCLILRVVQSVFIAATELKDENDMTI